MIKTYARCIRKKPFAIHLIMPQELRAIEAEVGVEILPGTEVMADIGDHHFVKGSKNVLVPQPSSDKHDPLVSFAIT